MNKTKIEWADYTWNPITGCMNGCDYCYARRMFQRFRKSFKPEFHEDRLSDPIHTNKPYRIFADSVSDFWSEGVKQGWRDKVYSVMGLTPQHTYFILTKRPERISRVDINLIPDNCFVGVSMAFFKDRVRIAELISKGLKKTLVSFEPILDDKYSDYIFLTDWIILGGLTGRQKPFRPPESMLDDIVSMSRKLEKPLFIKDNLGYPKKIQEFPK